MSLLVRSLPVGPLQCNCVIVGDPEPGEALVVDPGGDAERILDVLRVLHLRCTTLLHTHAHLDHVGATAELRRATGARVLMHADDQPLYEQLAQQAAWMWGLVRTPEAVPIDESPAHGDELAVGRFRARFLHTPGHSPGSLCLFFPAPESLLIAGDTLFADGVGRTDLPGGDATLLSDSLRRNVLTLPALTRVIPGHGPDTTIGRELSGNPFLAGLLQ